MTESVTFNVPIVRRFINHNLTISARLLIVYVVQKHKKTPEGASFQGSLVADAFGQGYGNIQYITNQGEFYVTGRNHPRQSRNCCRKAAEKVTSL